MSVLDYPGYPAVIPQLTVTLTRFIFGWDSSENINSEEEAGSKRIQAIDIQNLVEISTSYLNRGRIRKMCVGGM